jgi:hypothetical protein
MFRTDEDLVELTDQLVKLAYHWERVANLLAGHPLIQKRPPQIILSEEAQS